MAASEVRVGAQLNADSGSLVVARGGKTGEYIVQDAHAKYFEAVSRGNVFAGGTATSGVAPGTTISTTAGFALYNPLGSGKRLVVLKTTWVYISGTLGTGATWYNANVVPAAAAVTGTAITAVNCLLGSSLAAVGKPLTTATLPVAPTLLRPFLTLNPMLATSVLTPVLVVDYVDGEFVVEQGGCLSLHSVAAAGTSPLVAYGMSWEEVPVS